MSGSTAPLRVRVVGLVEGSAGATGWTIPAARFHVDVRNLEVLERTAIERAVNVHIDQPKPMEPINTLSGYGLYTRRLRVRVGYVLTESGDAGTFEVSGDQSGSSSQPAVEDRADEDGIELRAVIGSLRNWSGLAGVEIIDIAPGEPDGDGVEMLSDRAVATHVFVVKSRDALPGALGPAAP